MRQFDVVNTIVDIVFSGKTTGNYVESQTETTLDCKPKIYIVHGGTLRDHLKTKKETARLTARVINAILCRIKFYLYPDLQTIDPGKTEKSPEKLTIEPHDFANRCVAALMTLFDYNLLMLKVKEYDKNAGEKIDKIYDIIEKLLHIFEGESEIGDAIVNKVFMKIIISSVDNITNNTLLIYYFDFIWEFNRYTAKLFQYYNELKCQDSYFSKEDVEISETTEKYAEESCENLRKIVELLDHAEQVDLVHEREDLINKNYISSDDIVTDIYDAINIRIKKGSQTFSDNLKMTMADLIAANIIYKWRYRKTVKCNNDNKTKYELLVKTLEMVSKTIKKTHEFQEYSAIHLDLFTDFFENLKSCIDYLEFYSAVLHQFGLCVLNENTRLDINKQYVTMLTKDELDEIDKKRQKIYLLCKKIGVEFSPFHTELEKDL